MIEIVLNLRMFLLSKELFCHKKLQKLFSV